MTDTVERPPEPAAAAAAPVKATPKSPAARELGITAKLLFPTNHIYQDY